MRIVSQDGTIDIPYDDCVLSSEPLFYCGEYVSSVIYCNFAGCSTKAIANYSSPEKVLKVMKMVRDKYFHLQHNNITAVFRFPQDDEITV